MYLSKNVSHVRSLGQAAREKTAYLRELSLNMESELKALVQSCDDKEQQLKNEILKRESLTTCRDSLREEVQR